MDMGAGEMNSNSIIDAIWENAAHGTQREDIEAAYLAGMNECLKIARAIHAEAADVAHPDAEVWTAECCDRISRLHLSQATAG